MRIATTAVYRLNTSAGGWAEAGREVFCEKRVPAGRGAAVRLEADEAGADPLVRNRLPAGRDVSPGRWEPE